MDNELKIYIICGVLIILAVMFLSIVLYWIFFARYYYMALARYKEWINSMDADQLNGLYNREFPADFSAREINDWMKEIEDDTSS